MNGYGRLWNRFGDMLGATVIHPQYFVKQGEHAAVRELLRHVHGTFLDIGCGRQWYRGDIEKEAAVYYALDRPAAREKYRSQHPVELWADAAKIPLKDARVDTALMLMVLEHLPDPEKAIAEAYRVLAKKGTLVIGTVENYPGHDLPYNYYHWTAFGLRTILKRHGFRVTKLRSFGNFWETQVTFRNVFFMHLVKRLISRKRTAPAGIVLFVLLAPIMIGGNVAARLLGRGAVSREFALGHIVVAKKRT